MMETCTDASKKLSIEELPKEEILVKYRGLLNILQKAKQSKNALLEENNNLKQKLEERTRPASVVTEEVLEKLTQQKLDLLTALDELKSEKDVLQNKFKECELSLKRAQTRIVELETENEGYQRQVSRLTTDNDQLLIHLDVLEKQNEELKKLRMEQQQQLLELEKNNDTSKELSEKAKIIEALKIELEETRKNNENLSNNNEELCKNIETLKSNYKNAEILICDLKSTIQEKNKQNEIYMNTKDDLNIELHKNKALVEKLRQDVVTMTNRLSDSQIVSSGVASDLQNTNEKLRNKLKLYHSKIVKFATDVKMLKQQKTELLEDFRSYIQQVKLWESQLEEISKNMFLQFSELEKEKSKLASECETYKLQIDSLQVEKERIKSNNSELVNNLEVERKSETEKLRFDLEKLQEEWSSLLEHSTNLKSEMKIIQDQQEKEKDTLRGEIENLIVEKNRKEDELKCVTDSLNVLKSEITHLQNTNELLAQQAKQQQMNLQNCETKTQKLLTENENMIRKLNDSDSKLQEKAAALADLNQQKLNLQSELNLLKATEVKLAEQSAKEIQKLVQESKVLSEKNAELEQRLTEAEMALTKTLTSECGSQADDIDDHLSIVKRENAELLVEMNEMNQVLKERGETISKQQEYCEELLRNIKVYESQASKYSEMVRQKEEIITKLEQDVNLLKNQSLTQSTSSFNEMHSTVMKKDEEITQLRNELSVLKEKLTTHPFDSSQDGNYAESETMSTSTISRMEEMSRIKDLEGSWEERYGKLRSLALKLKAKIRDLTAELTKEQNEKAEVQQKLAGSIKTVQTLQQQCDKLQDELENSHKELKEFSKRLDGAALDISNSKKQLANNDETIMKLKTDIENLNKEKLNTDNWKKQVSSKVQHLKKELEANHVLKKDFENQISKLNSQLEAKDKLLKEEIEKHNSTKTSLQESHNECKKQSVLNLEMQDYERSLKDLTQKLDKKQELITKLKNQVDGQKNSTAAIKEQNRLLEERLQNEEADLIVARNEIQGYKKAISDLEGVISQKDDKMQDLTRSLESCRSENEDLSTQFSKLIAENQKACGTLKLEKDYLRSQNSGLEQKLYETQDSLRIKEDELKAMLEEYQNYKVRAQSVLRQNQTRDIGLEEKLSEEVDSFKAQVSILTLELNQLKNNLGKFKEENLALREEREHSKTLREQLQNELEESNKQHEMLTAKHQKALAEHAEALRGLKVHAEMLAQCYRQQLSEQEVRHNREVIELQSKIEMTTPAPEGPSLSPPAIPREQGEGSESFDTNHSVNIHPVPLDRLLSSESEQDINFVKKQLLENEAKVTHLAALLADTEQDLAKHVQMNKLLKEEIRRQQRSVEREQHAENLEYLKNVVFKFATLSSGDERSRLVPVLNTILKFSPEETSKLNMVAKGEYNSRGWTNYLPVWSSPGKPQ